MILKIIDTSIVLKTRKIVEKDNLLKYSYKNDIITISVKILGVSGTMECLICGRKLNNKKCPICGFNNFFSKGKILSRIFKT